MCGQRVLNIIAFIMVAICFCCAVVGTAGSQYSYSATPAGVSTKNWVYLYASMSEVGNNDRETTYYKRGDFVCKGTFDKLIAAFVFGLIGIATSFSALVLAFWSVCCKLLRWPVMLFSLMASVSLVIAFAISVAVYNQKQCDTISYNDAGYDVDWGLIILIIGAGFALLSAGFATSFCMSSQHN